MMGGWGLRAGDGRGLMKGDLEMREMWKRRMRGGHNERRFIGNVSEEGQRGSEGEREMETRTEIRKGERLIHLLP